jgi:hypothetical protein
MPKAALHHNDLTVSRKYNVWPSLQVFDVQAKAIAKPMQNGPHDQFGLCVCAPNPGHQDRPTLFRKDIHNPSVSSDGFAAEEVDEFDDQDDDDH